MEVLCFHAFMEEIGLSSSASNGSIRAPYLHKPDPSIAFKKGLLNLSPQTLFFFSLLLLASTSKEHWHMRLTYLKRDAFACTYVFDTYSMICITCLKWYIINISPDIIYYVYVYVRVLYLYVQISCFKVIKVILSMVSRSKETQISFQNDRWKSCFYLNIS